MQLSRSWVAAALLSAVAIIAAWTTTRVFSGAHDGPHGVGGNGWSLLGAGKSGPALATAQARRSPDQVREQLLRKGSLAGTEPAGDWCVSRDQKLQPCNALRLRFEYYLLGIGEVGTNELRSLVQDESLRANGAALTSEVMALWDHYWQLRTYAWKNHIDPSDRSTWLPVVEELHAVRQQILGAAWATAFFADDEAAFRADYARLETGLARPADMGDPVPQMSAGADAAAVTAARVARYGEAAAERLAQVDNEWANWDKRLNLARSEWARLQQAANLSDPQRKAAMTGYVQANFNLEERRRVLALLNL